MTQSEERYAHLLQPIRDLAANWSVNIANDLADYVVCTRRGAGQGRLKSGCLVLRKLKRVWFPALEGSFGKRAILLCGGWTLLELC